MSTIIGVIADLTAAYSRGTFRGVARFAQTHGAVRIATWPNCKEALNTPELDARPHALVGSLSLASHGRTIAAAGIPAVNTSSLTSPQTNALPRVVNNDLAVGRLAAEHYLARGFRNVAFVGIRAHHYSQQRHQGFAIRLAEAGLECAVYLPPDGSENDPIIEERKRLCAFLHTLPLPAAVFCCNDIRARHVVAACDMARLRVPDQIAVMGVDNDDLQCELASMPMSSVELAAEKIGYEAAAMVMRLLDGQTVPPLTTIDPLAVVTRRSTDVVAIDDHHVAEALRFIGGNAHRPIGVEDVLEHVPMSRRMLERRFRRATGRSILEEIRRRRVERAKELLASSDLSIGEVARAAGFGEAFYLSRVFHQYTGQTPREYRRGFQCR